MGVLLLLLWPLVLGLATLSVLFGVELLSPPVLVRLSVLFVLLGRGQVLVLFEERSREGVRCIMALRWHR